VPARRWRALAALRFDEREEISRGIAVGRSIRPCHEFLYGQLTDSNTPGIWLNGYVNGARGKTLIDGSRGSEHRGRDNVSLIKPAN